MRENLTVKTFDYSGLDPEVKSKLISHAGEIVRQKKSGLDAIMEMGKEIASAQELLSKPRVGSFGKWIELECGISRRTALNYLNAWRRFGNCDSLSQFSAEAIYMLATPNAPPEAAKKAQQSADKGVKVTGKVAKTYLPAKPSKNGAPAKPAEPAEPEPESFEPAELEAAPHPIVDIAGLASPYKRAVSDINRILREFEALVAEERTGVHLADKFTRIKHDLTEAKQAISQAEPVAPCEKCDGKGCKSCYQSGFWTRAIVGSRKK